MGKKEKKEIDPIKGRTVRLEIKFSIPKEEFDELLRKMSCFAEEKEIPKQSDEKKKD